jgi:hypothetical protein
MACHGKSCEMDGFGTSLNALRLAGKWLFCKAVQPCGESPAAAHWNFDGFFQAF